MFLDKKGKLHTAVAASVFPSLSGTATSYSRTGSSGGITQRHIIYQQEVPERGLGVALGGSLCC